MIKYCLIVFLVTLFSFRGLTQSWGDSTYKHKRVFVAVEVNPKFPGGQAGFYTFVSQNLKMPDNIRVSLAGNTVNVLVYLSETGKVVYAEVIKSPYPAIETHKQEMNNAAIELIQKMPDWSPALQNGYKVPCSFIIPLAFIE